MPQLKSVVKIIKKQQQIRYRIQQAKIVPAAIGERGVMKRTIVGLVLMLGLSTVLGACEGGGGEGGGGTTTTTTTSPAAEPADTGAATPPSSATTAPSTTTTTTAPSTTGTGSPTPTTTTKP